MELINEGKTKQIWQISPSLVKVVSKDRITAGDGAKGHDLKEKASISTKTTSKIFEILNNCGIQTAFVKRENETTFISKKCEMIPIEWVTRRLATGSFLRRHRNVKEGYKFCPPLQETFYKDDANHDPQWSDEEILSAEFKINGVHIGESELDVIKKTTLCVFEVLEKMWSTKECVLVDMKVEFGVDNEGNILLADVIDSDSWRLWPKGDKSLMKDKQVYRNLETVTEDDLLFVKKNFLWTANQLENLIVPYPSQVVIVMGSGSDDEYCQRIVNACERYGLSVVKRVVSAHKAPGSLLKLIAEYEGEEDKYFVFIAVAGRSNGLGPTLSANTTYPVINCPPLSANDVARNVWSSLELPSTVGCSTILYPANAALAAAHILSLHDYNVWMKLRVLKLNSYIQLNLADKSINGKQ